MLGDPFYRAIFVLLLLLLLAGCGPSPLATPPIADLLPLIAHPVPAPSPEDEAWDKLVRAARKEGIVTVYSSSLVGEIGRRLDQDFREQYGIWVEILAQSDNSSLNRIVVERRRQDHKADIMQSSLGGIIQLIELGLAESVAKELPAFREKGAFRFDSIGSPGGEAVWHAINYHGTLVNTTVVKPEEEPDSYSDLLESRWKGKLLISEPRTGPTSIAFFYIPRYYQVLDQDYYHRLAQLQPTVAQGDRMSRWYSRIMFQGEFSLWPTLSYPTVAPYIARGVPVKLLDMEEGTVATAEAVALVKGAPHPNAARLFMNWLLTRHGQISFNESKGSLPVRRDLPHYYIAGQAGKKPPKLLLGTWEAERWAIRDMKAGTMARIFGPPPPPSEAQPWWWIG